MAKKWYIEKKQNGSIKRLGPLNASQIREKLRVGELEATSSAIPVGTNKKELLIEIDEIFAEESPQEQKPTEPKAPPASPKPLSINQSTPIADPATNLNDSIIEHNSGQDQHNFLYQYIILSIISITLLALGAHKYRKSKTFSKIGNIKTSLISHHHNLEYLSNKEVSKILFSLEKKALSSKKQPFPRFGKRPTPARATQVRKSKPAVAPIAKKTPQNSVKFKKAESSPKAPPSQIIPSIKKAIIYNNMKVSIGPLTFSLNHLKRCRSRCSILMSDSYGGTINVEFHKNSFFSKLKNRSQRVYVAGIIKAAAKKLTLHEAF